MPRGRPPLPDSAARAAARRARDHAARPYRSGVSRPVVGADLDAARALILRALARLEATAGLGGRLRRYVVDGAPAGPWRADLARAIELGSGGPSQLRDVWVGRAPQARALARVTEYLSRSA